MVICGGGEIFFCGLAACRRGIIPDVGKGRMVNSLLPCFLLVVGAPVDLWSVFVSSLDVVYVIYGSKYVTRLYLGVVVPPLIFATTVL